MSQDRNTNRFPHRSGPSGPVARSSRARLLLLTGLFILVLVLMQHARRPTTWRWMWQMNDVGPTVDPFEEQVAGSPSHAGRVDGSFVSPAEPAPVEGEQMSLWIDPQRLADIRDDTYFRPSEKEIWFHLFRVLEWASDDELQPRQPGRGEPLTAGSTDRIVSWKTRPGPWNHPSVPQTDGAQERSRNRVVLAALVV